MQQLLKRMLTLRKIQPLPPPIDIQSYIVEERIQKQSLERVYSRYPGKPVRWTWKQYFAKQERKRNLGTQPIPGTTYMFVNELPLQSIYKSYANHIAKHIPKLFGTSQDYIAHLHLNIGQLWDISLHKKQCYLDDNFFESDTGNSSPWWQASSCGSKTEIWYILGESIYKM